jgi:hypothetical protein
MAHTNERNLMEQHSLKEVCDEVIARSNAYRLQHPDQEKAHRLRKRRMALKGYLGGFLWFMVIIVLPLVIDFMYPKMVPLLCWLNLSIICEVR